MDQDPVRCSVRGRPSKKWDRIYPHIETITQLYEDGYGTRFLGDLFGCSGSYMRDMLKVAGVPMHTNAERTGDRNPRWKEGEVKRQNGYLSVTIGPDNPFASMCEGKRPYVLQHRLIMAEALGRPLRSDETVHHINGIKDDNRIENLQLMTGPHRAGVSVCCGDCGSRNIVFEEL